jgi:hypothetical protein
VALVQRRGGRVEGVVVKDGSLDGEAEEGMLLVDEGQCEKGQVSMK